MIKIGHFLIFGVFLCFFWFFLFFFDNYFFRVTPKWSFVNYFFSQKIVKKVKKSGFFGVKKVRFIYRFWKKVKKSGFFVFFLVFFNNYFFRVTPKWGFGNFLCFFQKMPRFDHFCRFLSNFWPKKWIFGDFWDPKW